MQDVGRLILGAGLTIAAVGALVLLLERLGVGLGRLPGDIVMRGKNGTFYFPIVTCVLLSVLASLVLWLLNRR